MVEEEQNGGVKVIRMCGEWGERVMDSLNVEAANEKPGEKC